MSTFRISHTHGSPEGENSTYVFPERKVVIDPGPPSESSWGTLCTGLEEHGLEVADVRDVILTHWHSDHAGLGPRLAATADATLHMHEQDAPLVRSYERERLRRVERDADTLVRWGVPARVIADVRESDTPSPIHDEVPVAGHGDGEDVAGLVLRHTPGHTCGHLAVQAERTLYVGDAVLPMYTPNVGGSDTRTDSQDPLGTYLRTLDRIASWDVGRTARPGHGPAVALDERIAATRQHHRERMLAVVEATPTGGTTTPWAVARTLFGEMSGIHAKMGAGEAAAHLAYAARLGFIDRVGDRPVTYRASGQSTDDVQRWCTSSEHAGV